MSQDQRPNPNVSPRLLGLAVGYQAAIEAHDAAPNPATATLLDRAGRNLIAEAKLDLAAEAWPENLRAAVSQADADEVAALARVPEKIAPPPPLKGSKKAKKPHGAGGGGVR